MRGATCQTIDCCSGYVYFNPRTPCGVRHSSTTVPNRIYLFQSTHPMRGATIVHHKVYLTPEFQSTHPMRGATKFEVVSYRAIYNFNPRTPCGVRHEAIQLQKEYAAISIHAPHAGCDGIYIIKSGINLLFQSTHPMRGATIYICHKYGGKEISIHAPHAGCDAAIHAFAVQCSISIHAPHAGCDASYSLPNLNRLEISIHAPHAGCDDCIYL